MALLVLGARAAYTYHKRSRNEKLPLAMSSMISAPAHLYEEEEVLDEKKTATDTWTELVHPSERDSIDQSVAGSRKLAIFPQYVADKHTTLTIQKRLFPAPFDKSSTAPPAFIVNNTSDSSLVFKIQSDVPSVGHTRNIYAADGTHLLTVRRETLTVPRSYIISDPRTGATLLQIWGNAFAKADVRFTNASNGQEESLLLKGGRRIDAGRTVISDQLDGNEIAWIAKDHLFNPKLRQVVDGRGNSWTAEVMEGVDLALVVALFICVEDRFD